MTLIKNKGLFSKPVLIGRKMTNHRMNELFLKTKKRMYLASGAYFPVPGSEDVVSKKSESTKSKRSGTKKKSVPSSKKDIS